MTAVTLAPHPGPGRARAGGKSLVTTLLRVVELWCCYSVLGSQATGLLFGNHIVDASSLVYLLPPSGVNVF